MQTKKQSIVESLSNVFSGLIIAFIVSQLFAHFEKQIQYVWPSFQWTISASSNAFVTFILTLISIGRNYIVRRIFNKRHKDK